MVQSLLTDYSDQHDLVSIDTCNFLVIRLAMVLFLIEFVYVEYPRGHVDLMSWPKYQLV